MRGIGVIFCLFLLEAASGGTENLEGFHRNLLIALWASLLVVPIFLWILWQCTPLPQVIRRHLAGDQDGEARWELWMSLTFSVLLSGIVLIAFILASKGYYPR
jgi:hypothetical protein